MALKFESATLDDIDEAHRSLYVEKNGKFVLDVDADPGRALRTALQTERTTAQSLKKRLKELGIEERDDTEVAELLELGEKAKQGKGRTSDEVEQVKTALTKTHQKELDKLGTTITELTTTLERVLRDDAAKSAITAHEGDEVLLLPHVQSQTVVVRDEDGAYVARVKGTKAGEFRLNDTGDPMSVAELVAEMRADPKYNKAFTGSGGSGSGAPHSTTGLPQQLPETGTTAERRKRLNEQKRRTGAYSL